MIVTYTPEGEEPRSWEFKAHLVKAAAAELIENRAGLRFEEWAQEALVGRAKARRVLLWHLLTREHPGYRYEDTPDFAFGELTIQRDYDELIEHRSYIEKSPPADAEIASMVFAQLDSEIEARIAAGDSGKASARSKSSGAATS